MATEIVEMLEANAVQARKYPRNDYYGELEGLLDIFF